MTRKTPKLIYEWDLTDDERAANDRIFKHLLAGNILIQQPGGGYAINRDTGEGLNAATFLFRLLTPQEQGALFAFVLDTYRDNLFQGKPR